MDNYITLPITECVPFNHMVKTFCLPIKTACNNTVIDGYFVECDHQFNCSAKCNTDQNSYIMVPPDGTLVFQTNYKLPVTAEWGTDIQIELYDLQGNAIGELQHDDFSALYVVGNDGRVGYQTIEIDFSLVPIDCGYFRIYTEDQEVCTEYFKKEDCITLIEFSSNVKEFDCWNNYYGLSKGAYTGTDFVYVNRIFLAGTIKLFSLSNATNTQILRFTPSQLVGPFIAKYLNAKILSQKTIVINGEEWKSRDTTLTVRERSQMFWPIMEFERKVCSDNTTCS